MPKDNKAGKDEEIANMLLDDFDKFEHFAMNYWKQVAAVCVLIVIVVGIVAAFYAINGATERKANNAIANAKTETELQQVIKDYPKQSAVWSAYIRLGSLYIGKKDYPNAMLVYQDLLKKNIPDEMRRELTMNVSYLLELQNKKKEAIAAFVKVGSDSSYPEAMQCESNYSAGRLSSEIGDSTQAKTYLNLAASRVQKGAFDPAVEFWKRQAQLLLQRLSAPAGKAAVPAGKTVKTGPVKK